ncbi:hypothetical protein [Paraburkholderia phytofirmans]|uniref:hypothetical protein n=1 Tax=Paraburkholderia phytofirmans TaxID=261302 RepID=UPI0038BA9B92
MTTETIKPTLDNRRFFHSFPRPKKKDHPSATLDRGLRILKLMRDTGLILAPEVVDWDLTSLGVAEKEKLQFLQRRACFTELSFDELPQHAETFGPISLAFDITRLRLSGAVPVNYVPQGSADNPASALPTLFARGVYHTQLVLGKLRDIHRNCYPEHVKSFAPNGISPDAKFHFPKTSDGNGGVEVPISHVKALLDNVTFGSIPFDHSEAVLGALLNLYYPTDNARHGETLAYYRQREWRLFGGGFNLNGRPTASPLTGPQRTELEAIDPHFWQRTERYRVGLEEHSGTRSELALRYTPSDRFDFLELVEAIYAPPGAIDKIKEVVGTKVPIHPIGHVGA